MKLEMLSQEDIVRIDQAARKILGVTGVFVPHEEMLELFTKAGAIVDKTKQQVLIPSKIIDECLAQSGKTFTIYGRDRNQKAIFGADTRNYNSSAGQAHWLELNGNRRAASINDVIKAAKLGDVLPHLNIVGAMADPHDIDVSYRCVEVAAAQLRTTTKPIIFWFYDRASAKFLIELFTAVAGSFEELKKFPFTYPLLEPISPLRFNTNGIDMLFETCKVPLPVAIGPMAQAGLSAPVTLAGTVAQETAEILAGLCVAQLIQPGTPVCFAGLAHTFDMGTTQIIFGAPEQGIMAVALVQIGKYYGLSNYTNTGLTDSKCVDAQAGLEVAATMLMAAMAGSDIFGHLGINGADQAASLEILILQHEVIEYIERVMRGFEIDAEHLAVDLIDKVGAGGMFIDQMHTAEHFRQELWFPKLLDRSYRPEWENAGRQTFADKVPAYIEELISSYEEKPLPDDVSRDVEGIINDAKKNLSN